MPGQVPSVSAETSDFIEPLPIVVDYPNSITFRGRLRTTVKMSDLNLGYNLNRRECIEQIGIAQPVIAGSNAQLIGNPGDIIEWKWYLSDSHSLLGAPLEWVWYIYGENNTIVQNTVEQNVIITDNRYKWHSVETDNFVVYMSYKDEAIQEEVLSIGEDTLRYLRSLQIPTRKYSLFVYPSSTSFTDMHGEALGVYYNRSISTSITGFSPQEWQESPIYKSIIAHEVTHAALANFEVTCDQYIPRWFSEGYAEYIGNVIAPNNLSNKINYADYLAFAQLNGILPISEWGKNTKEKELYYSQSKYIFDYLISTYGDDKPHAVRMAISTTTDFEKAFAEVYGFPLSELGGKFTEYMNRNLLAHQQIPSNDISAQNELQDMSQAIIPTIVPLTVKTGLNQPNTNNRLNIYLTMLVLAISIVMIGIGKKIWSKRRTNKSTHGADLLHSQDGQHTSTSHNQSDNADKQAHGDDR